MEITCESCSHLIKFEGPRPRFCEQCGHRLETDSRDMETLPPTAQKTTPVKHAPTVGRYRLGNKIGAGGMGVVYEAAELDTGRRVALKLLSKTLAADRANVDRFVREGRLAAQLSHPRTTFVYEAGEEQGQPFIAMELMPGTTLQDVMIREGPMRPSVAVDYILDVIDGLIAAHKLNVIHRDVKPANCFVDTDGRIKVGDFGLSKSMVTDVELTRVGAFMGTPSFAAPEQIRGSEVDPRTDVYAVGATLYTLLSGRPPFVGDAISVTAQIISDEPEDLRKIAKTVPKDLAQIIWRCLRKNPSERFDNLAVVRRALLPYATKGASLAEVGRRAAAYMVDFLIVYAAVQVLMGLAIVLAYGSRMIDSSFFVDQISVLMLISGLVGWTSLVAYFAISEGGWGRSVGKRILGLDVVNNEGEKPGIWRASLRSFVIPGAFGVPIIALLTRWGSQESIAQMMSMEATARNWALDRMSELLPALFCVLTMRATNGWRGLHEFLSGTRVIRLATRLVRPLADRLPKIRLRPIPQDVPKTIGPFRVDGLIASAEKYLGLMATDELLDRKVWIYLSRNSSQTEFKHSEVNRVGRGRWLQGGSLGQRRWDAVEQVDGVPFDVLASNTDLFTWENTQTALADFATELHQSAVEGSVPDELTLSSFWIERNGHGKVVDLPMSDAPTSTGEPTQVTSCCYRCMREIVKTVREKQILPQTVSELFQTFEQAPSEPESLKHLAQTLKAERNHLPELRWDSRLGVLGVTIGTEWVAWFGLVLFCPWLLFLLLDLLLDVQVPVLQQLILPVIVFSGALFLIGYSMRGAPVFRFMGIDVQSREGGLPSRVRCGWRHLIAWFPFVVGTISAQQLTRIAFQQFQLRSETASESMSLVQQMQLDFQSEPALLIFLMCVAVVGNVIMYLAPIFSIASPQRGVQDYIAGTRLVPH